MDININSVASIQKFFTKLKEQYEQVAETTKKNSEVLQSLLKSEQQEEADRKKFAKRAKTRERRTKRNKKRSKLDTLLNIKKTIQEAVGGEDKKGGWLKKLLIGGGLVAVLGLSALNKFKQDVEKAFSGIRDSISGTVNDWLSKLTGQIDEDLDGIEEEAQEPLSEVIQMSEQITGERVNQPPAEASAPAAPDSAPDSAPKSAPEEATQEEPGTDKTTKTTKETREEDTLETQVTERSTKTESSTTVVRQESSLVEDGIVAPSGGSKTASSGGGSSTSSRRANRRSSSGSNTSRRPGSMMDNAESQTKKNKDRYASQLEGEIKDGAAIGGSMMQKAKRIAKRLMSDMRISAAAASGIVGNLMLESGLIPDNVENGKGFSDGPINNIPVGTRRVGYGYGQWTNDRLEKFRGWLGKRKKADKPATDEDNYKYLLHELRTTEPIRNHWKSGTSIPQDDPVKAANWFMMNWERPGKPHADRRQTYAKQVFAAIRKQQGGAIIGSSPVATGSSYVGGVGSAARYQLGGSVANHLGSASSYSGGVGSAARRQTGGSVSNPLGSSSSYGGGVGSAARYQSGGFISNSLASGSSYGGGVGSAARYQSGGAVTNADVLRLQGGGHVGIATEHIKKDEALSSLTPGPFPPGKSDWIREGGNSVITKQPWSEVNENTTIHSYTDGVGQTTIGWGSTYYDNISAGKQPVRPGDTITKKKADQVLHTNIAMLDEKYKKEMGPNWSKMSDSQRAALLSMGYNAPNFYASRTFAPKLKSALQAGDMKTAAANLEWGGPSPKRVKESQQMLRQGPMDLTKVKAPAPATSTSTKGKSTQTNKKAGKGPSAKTKQKQPKKQNKPWWRFGFQKGGNVSKKNAPVVRRQKGGSVFSQSNGAVSRPSGFGQSVSRLQKGGSVFGGAHRSASRPSGRPQRTSRFQKGGSAFGGVSRSAKRPATLRQAVSKLQKGGSAFGGARKSAKRSAGFAASQGGATSTGGYRQSNGSASRPSSLAQSVSKLQRGGGAFSQSNGSAARSAGFAASQGGVTSTGGYRQSNGSASRPASLAQSLSKLQKGGSSFGGASKSAKRSAGFSQSIAAAMNKITPLRRQTGGTVSGQSFVGQAPKSGGIVPGSGSGDQFPIALPEGSFVLNREATRTMQKLQTGGIASVGSSTTSKLEQRFFSANETNHQAKTRAKKQRVVVNGGTFGKAPARPSEVNHAQTMGGGNSGGSVSVSGGNINMNDLRRKMRRVTAGKMF